MVSVDRCSATPHLHHLYWLIFSNLPAEYCGLTKHEIFMVSYSYRRYGNGVPFPLDAGTRMQASWSCEFSNLHLFASGTTVYPNSARWQNRTPIAVLGGRTGGIALARVLTICCN